MSEENAVAVPTPRISEIVLRTSKFDEMQRYYEQFLTVKPSFEYAVPEGGPHGEGRALDFHRLCFLRISAEFPYTQVLALFELPDLGPVSPERSGMHHMQFRQATLEEWADRYDLLKSRGVRPYRTYNHGPSMSFYYEDPDGNLAEISGPNYSSDAEYKTFFASPEFAANPAGVEIDPEEVIARLRAGEDRSQLVKLPAAA
jgi:catechol 2,3-dioxygenase-like lactoylglutathione lyase family enzyme